MATRPCECEDFEPADGDDFDPTCVCGDVEDEHGEGFFSPCLVGHDADCKGGHSGVGCEEAVE